MEDEVIKTAKAFYQKGYKEGFSDACKLMSNAIADLATSASETIKEEYEK